MGRETESAVIEAFLGRAESVPSVLVIEGAAGIGKSTLWLSAVEAARGRGFHVPISRPAETERLLANVVLGDLFADVRAEDLGMLPAPRRRAFEAALLLDEALPEAVDLRALGVAIVTLLPIIAPGAPILISIDDDQWMDPSSATTLAFALRRIAGLRVSLLIARRTAEMPPLALEDAYPPATVERVFVGPLSVGAVQVLVRDRLGVVLSRPMQLRIHEVSGGNPFFALEVARTISQTATDSRTLVGVPTKLVTLVEARIETLDETARSALLLVAAHGRMEVALLPAASIARATLEAVRRAGIVETVDGVVRFTHPLLASAIYEGVSDDERRAAHRRLASLIDDPTHGARHVALAAEGPDEVIAASLESAARVASGRGLSLAAAELAEHAARLTPPDLLDDRRRRTVAWARARWAAGDGAGARTIAGDLLTTAVTGHPRAEALLLAAELETPEEAVGVLEEALIHAAGDTGLQATAHCALADSLYFAFTDREGAERHATAAFRLAERLDNDGLRADALSILAVAAFRPGERDALDVAERAYRLAGNVDDPRLLQRVGHRVTHILTWMGDTDRARRWLEERLAESADRDEWARALTVWYLALVEFWSGRWEMASAYADEAADIASQYGAEAPADLFPAALVALHRGDLQQARALAERGLALAGGKQLLDSYFGILGACDLWGGDAEAAILNFARAESDADALDTDEPSMREWRPEHVEALLHLGRVDEAAVLADEWDAAARRVGRDRVIAQATRCRGLVAAARGDAAAAIDLFEEAVLRHATLGDPYGAARAQLALGICRRRARQKRSAREALEAALAGFNNLGSEHWAAAARAELSRISGRQRLSGPSPSELAVATLAAEGRTNREIASSLFLSARTVASHLTHVYAKLGVRSRTELARHLAERPPPKVPTS